VRGHREPAARTAGGAGGARRCSRRRPAGARHGCRRAVPVALLAVAPLALAGAAPGPGVELVLAPERVELVAGKQDSVSLTLRPSAGHSISREGELTVTLRVLPEQGIRLQRQRYEWAAAADVRAETPRFDLGLAARLPGDYRLEVRADLWVCGKRTCVPVRAERQLPVRVAPAGRDGRR
jgi:hypothetical protein